MSKTYMNCEIARRADGYVNVWAMLPWPDEDLDTDPTELEEHLERTNGWRVEGWQVVHVASTMRDAHNWVHNNAGKL